MTAARLVSSCCLPQACPRLFSSEHETLQIAETLRCLLAGQTSASIPPPSSVADVDRKKLFSRLGREDGTPNDARLCEAACGEGALLGANLAQEDPACDPPMHNAFKASNAARPILYPIYTYTSVRRFGKRKRRAKNLFDGGPIKEYAMGGEVSEVEYWEKVREAYRSKARELGFTRAGVTTAEPSARLSQYEEWIRQGKHGEMGYLGRDDRLERRRDLNVISPGVRSVLCVMLTYWPGKTGFPTREQAETDKGVISCYAWGEDYHAIIGEKLKQLCEWLHSTYGGSGRWYVDTGPLMERDLAARSGLGFIGKNTLHINEHMGSGHFLAEILTTLPLPPDPPRKKTGGCGKCRKCIVACPTQAIDANGYTMDARRCISYLTIEHKGRIDPDLRPLMRNLIYGCDICQAVCPWNRFSWPNASPSSSPLFGKVPSHTSTPSLLGLLSELKDDEAFVGRFRGTAIERIGRERMLRNVAIAIGNSKDAAALPVLREVMERERGRSDVVVEHIEWAIQQIDQQQQEEEEGGRC